MFISLKKVFGSNMRVVLIIILVLFTAPIYAEEKFFIDGNTLIYATDTSEYSEGITSDDVAEFSSLLESNEMLRVVNLSSGGGEVQAAYEIVDLIIDYQLDTHVVNFCESACTLIFLAGLNRTADIDAKIGFHQTSISSADAELEYKELKQELGFNTPFDYAAWLLEDTQDLVLNDLYYYSSIGLSLDFVIKTMEAYSDEMWYPDHTYMLHKGVLTR